MTLDLAIPSVDPLMMRLWVKLRLETHLKAHPLGILCLETHRLETGHLKRIICPFIVGTLALRGLVF